MISRRTALTGVGIAALVAQTPSEVAAAEPEMVTCCMASVFLPDHRSQQGLLFDLPQGLFLVDHVALYKGSYVSVKDGPVRFVDAKPKDIHRSTALSVPRTFLDEALALHATHERIAMGEQQIWQRIREANGITAL